MIRYILIVAVPIFVAVSGGCIELEQALLGVIRDTSGGRPPVSGVDTPSGDQQDAGIPAVRLAVSNPNPQVSEEVLLTCEVVRGDRDNLTFGFQGAAGRLLVDQRAGTASFIVDQSDIGEVFTFTCTATNAAGTSQPSDEQTIIPTS